jgi:putative transposase
VAGGTPPATPHHRGRAARRAALDAVQQAHRFECGCGAVVCLRVTQAWVREHLLAQETQNLGARAFDAVRRWHLGSKGKPRFKSTQCGLHSLAANECHGALRPKTDPAVRVVGLGWGPVS